MSSEPQAAAPEPAKERQLTATILRVAVSLVLLGDALLSLPSWGNSPDAPGLLVGLTPLFVLGAGTSLLLSHLHVTLALLLLFGVASRGALLALATLSLVKALAAWPWLRLDHLLLLCMLPCLAADPGGRCLSLDPVRVNHPRRSTMRLIVWLVTVALVVGVSARLLVGWASGGATVVWLGWLPRMWPGLTEAGLLSTARAAAIMMLVADLLLLVALRLRRMQLAAYVLLVPTYLALAGASLMSRHGDWLMHALVMTGVLIAFQPPLFMLRMLERRLSAARERSFVLQPEIATPATTWLSLVGLALACLVALPWILRWTNHGLPITLRAQLSALGVVWLAIIMVTAGGAWWPRHSERGEPRLSGPRVLRAGLYFGTAVGAAAMAAILLRVGGTVTRHSVHWTRGLLARGDYVAAELLATDRSLAALQPMAAARARLLMTPNLLREGQVDRAESLLSFSRRHIPDKDPELESALGALSLHRNHPRQAIEHYRRALRSELSTTHLLRLAAAHTVAEEFREAITLLNRALILDPRNVDAHLALGIAFYSEGRMDEALRRFDRAILLAPWNAQAHFFRAGVHVANRKLALACMDLRKARRLSPDRPDVTLALARCVFHTGDPAKARGLLEEYLRRHPDDGHVRANLDSMPSHAPGRAR